MKISKILFLFCLVFAFVGCDKGGDDDFFPSGTPSATATVTLTSGSTQLASRDPYCFSLTVSGVNGPAAFGRFSASFSNLTGSVGVEGLAVVFDELVQTGTNTYTANGCVTGPFTGQGNVDINVVYDETGITIFGGTFTFTVAVNSFVYCSPLSILLSHPDYLPPTITVTNGPTSITDVDVLVDIGFGFSGNLDVNVLTSPSGTDVALSETLNPRLDLVILDDESPFPVSSLEDSPNGGRFAPIGFLSDFDGENANGTWSISFPGYFTFSQYTSSFLLQRWCLLFNNHELPPNTLTPRTVCDFVPSGDDDDDDDDDIPDGGTLSRVMTVVAGPTSITDLNISRLDINHAVPTQLTVTLTSPQGTTVILSDGNGSVADAFNEIILDDSSLTSITTLSTTQRNRSYVPENPLSAFTGQNANGNWTLSITDNTTGTTGILDEWCLNFDGGAFSGD